MTTNSRDSINTLRDVAQSKTETWNNPLEELGLGRVTVDMQKKINKYCIDVLSHMLSEVYRAKGSPYGMVPSREDPLLPGGVLCTYFHYFFYP